MFRNRIPSPPTFTGDHDGLTLRSDPNEADVLALKQPPPDIDQLVKIPLSNNPWILCFVIIDEILPKDSEWDKIKSTPGIYLFGRRPADNFCEVLVNISYLPWLRRNRYRFMDKALFESTYYCDPTAVSQSEIDVYGEWSAAKRFDQRFLDRAYEAAYSRCNPGIDLCLRAMAHLPLKVPLEWTILCRDIGQSEVQVQNKFAQCLVFLALNSTRNYDTLSITRLLGKDRVKLLETFTKEPIDLLRARTPSCLTPQSDYHIIALIRSLLECCGGKEDFCQNKFDINRTATDNVKIFGSIVGVTGTNSLGSFHSQAMRRALSTSKVYAGEDVEALDLTALSDKLIRYLPIGFPSDLGLPIEVVSRLSVGQVNEVRTQVEDIFKRRPRLQKEENRVQLLLAWSSRVSSLPLALSEWAATDEGLNLYQQILQDVQEPQPPEQLALALAALLCHRRLLPHPTNEAKHSIKGSYLADFDALLKGEPLRNERAVFERMIFSIQRVLETFGETYFDIRQFLNSVLSKYQPLMEPFDGFSDQYWVRRMKSNLAHQPAFRMIWLPRSMGSEVGLGRDRVLFSLTDNAAGRRYMNKESNGGFNENQPISKVSEYFNEYEITSTRKPKCWMGWLLGGKKRKKESAEKSDKKGNPLVLAS